MDVDDELVAYVGGIDVTSGRYDDQSHPLFRPPESDYYQYTIAKPVYGQYVGDGRTCGCGKFARIPLCTLTSCRRRPK